MIFYAEFTGNVVDNWVEVKVPLFGVRLARPSYAFPLISLITKEWLKVHGTGWFAICTHESGNPDNLVCVGMCPKDDYTVDSQVDITNIHWLLTEKYRIKVSDKDNFLELSQLTSTNPIKVVIKQDNIFIESPKSINFGKEEADEAAILGDTFKSHFDAFFSDLSDFLDVLVSATYVGGAGPYVPGPATVAKITDFKSKVLSKHKDKLVTLLSKKVKLDK